MAIDLDAIKRKLEQLQNTGQKRDTLWRPEAGSQIIRIVPYQHDRGNPFQELYFNYEVGKKNYLSPITFGRPDPVVEFCEKLKSSGNSDEWKLARRVEPKMRTYVPILIRGKESEGVKFWGFGKKVYTELLGFISDPDYGDISDPVHGRDIVVNFQPAESDGAYPKTSIRVKPNVTPLTDDRNIAEQVAKNQPKLEDIFKEPTYDELKEALEKWLNPEDETEETVATNAPTDTTTTTETPKAKDKEIAGVEKVEDVSAAFDELFNDEAF